MLKKKSGMLKKENGVPRGFSMEVVDGSLELIYKAQSVYGARNGKATRFKVIVVPNTFGTPGFDPAKPSFRLSAMNIQFDPETREWACAERKNATATTAEAMVAKADKLIEWCVEWPRKMTV